jgi:hypothetical protein
MGFAQRVQLASSESNVRSRDFSIMLGYAAFTIVMLIAVGLARQTGGNVFG